jgi:7-keto-8-aminopelargonate synthetase-like enzyme
MSRSLTDSKSKHEVVMDLINKVADITVKLGVVHQNTQDEVLDGRHITLEGQKMLYFGSCGYLGLEHDSRLKKGAIEAIQKYGTQFSSSRAYVSSAYYQQAESLLSQIFGKPSLLLQSLTVGHTTNIPLLVGNDDAIIMDAQVHDSVQNAVLMLSSRGIHVEVVRHNRVDMLESRIKALKDTYKKIWYMADGVYSMQGDFAPIKELYRLADQYEQLHLYIDDIHGMSWTGPNGGGYVMSQGNFHSRLYLTTGLTKAFGTAGGLLVFPNEESHKLVKTNGKSFIFSIQMPPMILGATIESAKIHLSQEINSIQQDLSQRVAYFNQLSKELGLPLIHDNDSPIRFVGVGKPETGYNMVRRMMNRGFFFNLSVFPSVSYNRTGLRIPLNRLHTFEDIELLLNEIAVQLPLALADSNGSLDEIRKFFRKVA